MQALGFSLQHPESFSRAPPYPLGSWAFRTLSWGNGKTRPLTPVACGCRGGMPGCTHPVPNAPHGQEWAEGGQSCPLFHHGRMHPHAWDPPLPPLHPACQAAISRKGPATLGHEYTGPAGLKAASPHGLKLGGQCVGSSHCLGEVSEGTAWHRERRTPAQSRDSPSCSLPRSLPWPGAGWGAECNQGVLSNTLTSNISPAPGTQGASVSLCKLAGYRQWHWDGVTFRGREPLLRLGISRHHRAVGNRLGGGQLGSRGAHTALVLSPWGAPHSPVCSCRSLGRSSRGTGVQRLTSCLCHILRQSRACPRVAHPIRAGQDTQPAGSQRPCTPLRTPTPSHDAHARQATEQQAWQGHSQGTRSARQEHTPPQCTHACTGQ